MQLDVTSDPQDGAEVWLLLTRHLRSHRAQEEFIALTAHGGSGLTSAASFGNDVLSTKVGKVPTFHCAQRVDDYC